MMGSTSEFESSQMGLGKLGIEEQHGADTFATNLLRICYETATLSKITWNCKKTREGSMKPVIYIIYRGECEIEDPIK